VGYTLVCLTLKLLTDGAYMEEKLKL